MASQTSSGRYCRPALLGMQGTRRGLLLGRVTLNHEDRDVIPDGVIILMIFPKSQMIQFCANAPPDICMRASFWDEGLIASTHISEFAFSFPFIKLRHHQQPHHGAASAVLTALTLGRALFHPLVGGHAAILGSQVHQFKEM